MIKLNAEQFLQTHWQKQPKVIRQGFNDFIDPLDEHDLAGLAQLEEIDSRIVSLLGAQWQVAQGPFEDFEPLCQGQWSLLVQGVNQYIPEANYLLDEFSFIPNWRIDDLMVSYSVAQAGVGPHIDQYDVFIIQGKGRRRWQVGPKANYKELLPHPKLKQIEIFEPIIDVVLEPGDIIYIPPGYPHNGVALEPCLNYSVGFRAPDQIQLLDSFVDYCAEQEIASARYADPKLKPRKYSAEISSAEITALKKLMQDVLMSENFEQWFLGYSSEISCPIENEFENDEISDRQSLQDIEFIEKAPHTQTVFLESEQDNELQFAINGVTDSFYGRPEEVELLKQILSERQFKISELLKMDTESSLNHLVLSWIEKGLWEPDS